MTLAATGLVEVPAINGDYLPVRLGGTGVITFDSAGGIIVSSGGTTALSATNSPTVTGVMTASSFVGKAGTGSGAPVMIGTLSVNTTAVGNVGAGTDDLMTYTLPANSLSANGKGVRITAWGATAANANAKTITVNFGGTTVLSVTPTTFTANAWHIVMDVYRSGSSAQVCAARYQQEAGAVLKQACITVTETDTAAITIKLTANAVADNDVVQKLMFVEFIS